MAQMDKHRETFKEEAYELLGALETALLELEESPDNVELIGRVFRVMHTVKGSGAMFGFDDIADFTHEIETIYDLVRNGKMAVTKELINSTLLARDQIRAMLDANGGNNPAIELQTRKILELFKKLVPDPDEDVEAQKPAKLPQACVLGENITCRITFRPQKDVFMNGTNPLCLLRELEALGNYRIIAHTENIPPLEEITPESCYTYWDIILTTRHGIDAVKDVFIFVENNSEVDIKIVDEHSGLNNEDVGIKKLGEILVERGDIQPEDLQKSLDTQKRIGDILVESGLVTKGKVQSALAEQQQVKEVRTKHQSANSTSSIRVPAAKLDKFVDLVGELVIIQQRLSQTVKSQDDTELSSIAEQVERLTTDLRDTAFSVRMLPIGTLFTKFKRLVRDLSNDLGREVGMTTDGADTELDKTLIEQLNDPLVHIIRNSIDHGIEPPEVREAAGKPRHGTIHLSAVHSGSNVLIQIRDDGKGLDLEAIRKKAIEKGMIEPGTELSEKECISLIFAPGFSTAKKVTNVSGRGVGMDVVKKTIDALRGTIEINNQHERGTTTTIKLPLTLAIIEGLQVEVGGEHFVLPLSAVEECVELTHEEFARSKGRRIANVRGEIVPYLRLREWFLIDGESYDIEQIVITKTNGRRVGFVVDRVVGEHQTVIKALGKVYRHIQGISGATILGDGRVALILDVLQLVQNAESAAVGNAVPCEKVPMLS